MADTNNHSQLKAINPIDGRYHRTTEPLAAYFSEFALMHKRLVVECEYLIALSEERKTGMRSLTEDEKELLRRLPDISIEDARIIKRIEKEGYEGIPATNHDVKAVEYFIKSKLKGTSLEDVSEWVHFALTSEDINSVAHGFAVRSAIESVMLPTLADVEGFLVALKSEHAATPMLARTHGQPASPTTFGKEMAVFAKRLERQVEALKRRTILVKFGGATGNYSAHAVAIPEVDWPAFAAIFIESLNTEANGKEHFVRLALNDTTTQIEPHDTFAEMFDNLRRANTILTDLSQDMWRYISDGWVVQKLKEGEVGSSAMPHKVNPIDFENAEGNFGLANALFEHLSRKLPVSRLQRDLSDSTVERSIGVAFAYSLIGYKALLRGLGNVGVNQEAMLESLQAHPEVIAEAIQTVLRKEGVKIPYEKLKNLTRGKKVTMEDFAAFIEGLEVADGVKARLKELRPENYIGLAAEIAKG
ncbi:MAG: adenylosuccinate lyase [Patescibacteria group bacterium]|nr:adenylosuccinate lyase [Patescibacteria group bacterium]